MRVGKLKQDIHTTKEESEIDTEVEPSPINYNNHYTEAMQSKLLSLVSLIALISSTWCAASLYSFGTNVGDKALLSGANPAANIKLRERYAILGENFTQVFVSQNY